MVVRLQERPAGSKLRQAPSRADRFLNSYQRELVRLYDGWRQETVGLMLRAQADGRSDIYLAGLVAGRLEDLEARLVVLGRGRIFQAGMAGLGKGLRHRKATAGVRLEIAGAQRRNDTFLRGSLLPDIRARLLGQLRGDRAALLAVGEPFRARVAGYSGGATVAMFEVQKRAGADENAERRATGQPPIAVRWVLDPQAEHCEDDPRRGTFGCPGLAGVYPGGWGMLPTVPAGNVSCLGNCRCALQIDVGRGWEAP